MKKLIAVSSLTIATVALAQNTSKYPYEAILSCEFRGQPTSNIAVCFADKSNGTELKIKNGDEVNVYKFYEVQRAGDTDQDGLHIPLQESFEIRAQNASEHYILRLVIRDAATGKQLGQQAAGQWKTVAFRN